MSRNGVRHALLPLLLLGVAMPTQAGLVEPAGQASMTCSMSCTPIDGWYVFVDVQLFDALHDEACTEYLDQLVWDIQNELRSGGGMTATGVIQDADACFDGPVRHVSSLVDVGMESGFTMFVSNDLASIDGGDQEFCFDVNANHLPEAIVNVITSTRLDVLTRVDALESAVRDVAYAEPLTCEVVKMALRIIRETTYAPDIESTGLITPASTEE